MNRRLLRVFFGGGGIEEALGGGTSEWGNRGSGSLNRETEEEKMEYWAIEEMMISSANGDAERWNSRASTGTALRAWAEEEEEVDRSQRSEKEGGFYHNTTQPV